MQVREECITGDTNNQSTPNMPEAPRSNMYKQVGKIICVVLGYWTISISMVFANKYLVGDNKNSTDVSIFVAWFQCAITVVTILIMKGVRRVLKGGDAEFEILFNQRQIISWQVLQLTCTFVGMLTFNNLCLKHVGVAFFQVARSMTLVFTVIFSVIILKKSVSVKVVLCCLMVAGGFILGVDQEKLAGTLSIQGVTYGVITSLFVSLNGIFTKRALEIVDKDSVKLTLYNNLNASILFIPFVIGTGQLQEVLLSERFQDLYFWLFLIFTGALSFLIAWVSALQIDLTSPVTHHISANSKAVIQTLIAVITTGVFKSTLWWFSNCVVVGGALSYALVRLQEERAAARQHSQATEELEKGSSK